jgi:hypothetical protein
VVVVPLRPGAREQIRSLLDEGPPFDPEAAGLERHEVFLSDEEAIFLFEAVNQSVLDRLARSTKLRVAAVAWEEYVAGGLRLADLCYSWNRGSGVETNIGGGETGSGDHPAESRP